MGSFKENIQSALKKIIQKQTRLGLNSRFIFGKILKSVNESQKLENWEDFKELKFVGEKTLEKVKEQMLIQTDLNEIPYHPIEPQIILPKDDDSYLEHLKNVCEKYEKNYEILNSKYNKESENIYNNETKNIYNKENNNLYPKENENIYIKENMNSNIIDTKNINIKENKNIYTKDSIILETKEITSFNIEDNINIDSKDLNYIDTSSDIILIDQPNKNVENMNLELEKIFDSFSDLNLDDSRKIDNIRNHISFMDTTITETLKSNTSAITGSQRKRRYIPGYRTAAYAILKALYKNNGSHKHLVVLRAAPYTDAEFDKTQRFSAFSAFKILQKKGLIKIDSDQRCNLTPEGTDLCSTMFLNDSFSNIEDHNIQIVIDSREKKNNRDRTYFQTYFSSKSILNQTRYLNVGDFIWIKNERVLDVIVERKQTSDFSSSISDGRFREQKNRLKNLGFTVYYLIENIKIEEDRKGYVNRCLLEVMMEGFVLIETENIQETALVLEKIDEKLKKAEIKNETPVSYGSFINDGNKNNIKVKDILLISLLSVKGLSKSFARLISEKYKTILNFRNEIKNKEVKKELRDIRYEGKNISEKIVNRIIFMFS